MQHNLLPETGFIRLPVILKIYPVGKSTWWAGVKEGRFPQPVKLGWSPIVIPKGQKEAAQKWKQYQTERLAVAECDKLDCGNTNIAIVTRAISNLLVIDIDGPEGYETLAGLEAQYGELPKTPCVVTKRGMHL